MDDDDCMDIDGVEFINEVHKEIQNVRNMSEDPSNLEADIFSSFNDTHLSSLKTCKQLAVVDTNFLISNLGYVHTIVTIAEGSKGRLVIILPWIVIKELDKLKMRQGSVKDQAIKAMLYLQKKLSQKIISLKGQKMNEKHNKSTVIESNDDRILDCCLYFRELTEKKVTLLSNDRNLCIKAMVHDIDTLSAEQKSKMEVFLNTIESGDTQYTYIKGITEIRPSQGLKTVVPKKVGESLKDGHRTNKKMEVETHIVHDMEIDHEPHYAVADQTVQYHTINNFSHQLDGDDDIMMIDEDEDYIPVVHNTNQPSTSTHNSIWANSRPDSYNYNLSDDKPILIAPRKQRPERFDSIRPSCTSNKSSWASIHAPK